MERLSVAAWVEASCASQGVPVKVCDLAVVETVAGLLDCRIAQRRQRGVMREGSKVARPLTAGPTVARSRRAATIAR
jgi:hypothetical protein